MDYDNSKPEESGDSQTATTLVSNKTEASTNWALGIAIVVIGALLLARNLGYEFFLLEFDNWWAVFIMLAALGPLQQAIKFYRKEGFSFAVANSLVSAGAIIFVSLLFLLDLSFRTWWPVFVIVLGLYLMTNRNRS